MMSFKKIVFALAFICSVTYANAQEDEKIDFCALEEFDEYRNLAEAPAQPEFSIAREQLFRKTIGALQNNIARTRKALRMARKANENNARNLLAVVDEVDESNFW